MIIISGFVEVAPPIPGGLWMWDGARVREIYTGGGVFGLAWWRNGQILLGATRDDARPFVAFAREGAELRQIPIRYERFIPGRRMHGIAVDDTRVYAVAAQGDPDAEMSVNTDRWRDHRVGKVLMSELRMDGRDLIISNTEVWNPYGCAHHHHYNDILLHEAFIYLASFSTCDESKRLIDHGAVTRFRKRDGSIDGIVSGALNGPHSIELEDDRMFVCSSEQSAVVSFLRDAINAEPRLEYKGINNFIRGLVVTPRRLFVGLNRSAGRTEGDRFTEPINGVLQFDRTTGDARRIQLPDVCENVYSIIRFDVEEPPAATISDPVKRRAMFSCVMDATPKYVAQARLLVRTLVELGGVAPADIIVHSVGSPDASTQRFFEAEGVTVATVAPFDVRHPHSNKLVQLENAALQQAPFAVLCDCDLAFCNDIRDAIGSQRIRAKLVDYANIPIDQWRRIFRAGDLPFPDTLACSTYDHQPTLPNYCNGGMLVIPQRLFGRLREVWPRWNRFLLARPALLERFTFFTDQVSFTLALAELGESVDHLGVEYNFPTHLEYAGDAQPAPRVLHYHDRVDGDGLLTPTGIGPVDERIRTVNDLIRRTRGVERSS